MKLRKWVVRTLAALILLALGGLIWAWVAIHRIPDWYTPARVAPQNIQAVKDDVTGAFNEFSEAVNRDEPFYMNLSQDQVNRWLAVRDEFGPEVRRYFPDWLSDPMVIVKRDRIGLAGTVSAEGFRSVVSLWFEVAIHGEQVHVKLTDVFGGTLRVPKAMVLNRIRDWLEGSDPASDRAASRLRAIEQLLAGKELDNHFSWENGRRDFRLLALEAVDGGVRLRAQALPDSSGLLDWTWKNQRSDDWPPARTRR
jgi:hypothetical protein